VTRFIRAALAAFAVLLAPFAAHAAEPKVQARAWVLVDVASGRTLAAHQADLPLPPASLVQLMTAYVLFGDLRANKISLGETIRIPESAVTVDGSRLFLKAGDPVSVDTLIKGMLVVSATDATLALVISVDSTEAAFVERMNAAAKKLGMTRTRFTNATGHSDPEQRSSAQDMAKLARALLRDYPERQGFFNLREVEYQGTTFFNKNLLLWRDPSVDGLKAGRTLEAGYALAASARRGNQRRVAVVFGARNETQRTAGAQTLLNHGFEAWESRLLYRGMQPVKRVEVFRGARDSVNLGFLQDFHLLADARQSARMKAQVITQRPIVAPIARGQRLGTLRLTVDGKPVADYPLVAQQDVAVAGILGRGWDSIRLLFAD
jgi:D-alanyl-D-alanine carboxypeptidase/D-alanyl-D-alanine carboxypeptidase (penicillin-binding protein 5/6)